MRIVSLVPSATETLFALGLGGEVIAVTHECDYPPAATELPRVTRDVLPVGLTSGEIDAAVRERVERGESIYELDADLLVELRPELIVTQALCDVCAVSFDDVRALARRIDPEPRVVSLDPNTLGEVLGDVRTLAETTEHRDEGVDLVRDAATRRTSRATGPRSWSTTRAGRTCWASRASAPSPPPGTPSPPRDRTWWWSCRAGTTPSARARRPSTIATASTVWAPGAWWRWTRRLTSRAPARG